MVNVLKIYRFSIFTLVNRFIRLTMAQRADGELKNMVQNLLDRLDETTRLVNTLTAEINNLKNQAQVIKCKIGSGSSEDTLDSVSTLKRPRLDVKFTYEDDYLVVYTDGACENNGKSNARAGIGVWFNHNHPLNVSSPVQGRATNNTAEIQACVKALKIAQDNGINKVKINTDSEFTINCMTKWIWNWKKNNWKLASGGPVKNKEELQVLDNYCQKMTVKWNHVRGHEGIEGNEEADKLAREGALKYAKN